jgi:hypothetical protein
MDYELSASQAELMSGLDSLLSRYRGARLGQTFFELDADLARELRESGFLNVSREEGYGPLEAALVVAEVAQLPQVVEIGASALIAPQLGLEGDGRYAVTSYASIRKAIRFLPIAHTLLIEHDDLVYVLPVDSSKVEPVTSVLAYPYGRLATVPDLRTLRDLGPGSGRTLRQWQRVALAIEAWGAAEASLAHTVAYVKERQVFGRALGTFQAVHHRLALCAEQLCGARWLAFKAAWSGAAGDAALAATHIQTAIPTLTWDFHQFNGAQSWPLANPLHFWTFRLRALQSEMGGAEQQALAVAAAFWGE